MASPFNIIQRILFLSAGASNEGLAQCPESEHRKYGFIGAIILLTSLFAMLSGGYALFYIFHSEKYAAIFAFLWGTFILNLDRFIISSMRKYGSFWKEFRQALPRIVLALIIAISIARPLEIGIFAEEIEDYLVEQKSQKKMSVLNEFNTYIDKIRNGFEERLSEDMTRLDQYRQERIGVCTQRDEAHSIYLCERDGTCGTSEKGYGPEAIAKRKRYEQLDEDCRSLTARVTEIEDKVTSQRIAFARGLAGDVLENLQDDSVLALEETKEINNLKRERDSRLREVEQSYSVSFSSMNTALWALQNSDRSVMAISIVISLLFIVVEAAPMTVKLLAPKGPYDYYLDFERDTAEANYLRGREKLYEEMSTEYQREIEDLERKKQVDVFRAFQAAQAPLEKQMLQQMLDEWQKDPALKDKYLSQMGRGLERMINDYSAREGTTVGERGKGFSSSSQGGGFTDTTRREPVRESAPAAESEAPSLVSRFLIVPVTFLVTVAAFMMGSQFTVTVSPFVVALLAGLFYITLCTVYFSLKDRSDTTDTEGGRVRNENQ